MNEPITISDVVEMDPKEQPFQERAANFEKEQKPLIDKWGVVPWAVLSFSQEGIAPQPVIKDLWPKAPEEKPVLDK